MKKDLQKLFDEYIYECRVVTNLRPETIRGYKETFRNFAVLMPEVRTPESLTPDLILEFFKRLKERKRLVGRAKVVHVGVKDSTARTYWSKLNSFFEHLYKKDLLVINPFSKLKAPQPIYNDKRALPGNEFHRLVTAVTLHSKNSLLMKRDLVMLYLLIFCGLRRGELIGIQVRDIDISKRILRVRGESSKSKRDRLLPLNNALALHLEDYFNERSKLGKKTEYLLVSANGDRRLTLHGLKHWVKRLGELSGVKFHLHRMRHTFACNLARNGTGVYILQSLMGHTDLRMTQQYLRSLTVEDLRADVDRLTIDNLV